jgi:DNA-binding XRE family transcriptional regulator
MREWTNEEIRDLRSRLGLSQTAFGELVGITRIAVYYLEKGVRTPSKTLAILMDWIDRKEMGKEVRKHAKKNARTV